VVTGIANELAIMAIEGVMEEKGRGNLQEN